MQTHPQRTRNKPVKTRLLLTFWLGSALLFNASSALGYGHMMSGGMMGSGMMGGGMMGGSSSTAQGSASDNAQPIDDPGAKLFRHDCSQCHVLPSPLAHKANQWPSVVERMRAHLRQYGGRDLSDQETQAILGYLKKQARH